METPGELLRSTRRQSGLSQRRVALRAGTTQARLSRIENGLEAPSFECFERLLLVMGERLVVKIEPRSRAAALRDLSGTPADRLREAASWNFVATRLELAGERARRAGHPAMRRAGPP